MHNDSYEDEAPDQYTRDYGIGGNGDDYSCPMPLWGKVIWLVSILGGVAFLYELVHGNRAVMIALGCAIAIVGGFLWKENKS